MSQSKDRYVRSGDIQLRSSGRRRLLFASPLIGLTAISLATTWQNPRALVPLLLFGLFIGLPFLWWAVGHRVELKTDRVRHLMPMAPIREVSLTAIELVDIRPSDRRWPFRAYVVTLATREGEYLPFETANFASSDVVSFLEALMDRVPNAHWTDRAESMLRSGL